VPGQIVEVGGEGQEQSEHQKRNGDEVAWHKANFLLVGGPRKPSKRSGINHLGGRALNEPDYYET